MTQSNIIQTITRIIQNQFFKIIIAHIKSQACENVVIVLAFVNKPQKVTVRPSDKLTTQVTTDMHLTFIGTHSVLFKNDCPKQKKK